MRLMELWIMKFAAKCPPGKRGRPMSKSPEAAEAAGFEVCEKETRDGRTVAYKTGRQLEKEKEARSEKQSLRKEAGISSKGRISKANLQKLNDLKAKLDSLKAIQVEQETKKTDVSNMPTIIQKMYKNDDIKGLKKIANVYGVAPKKGMAKDEIIESIRKGMAKQNKKRGQ